MAKELLVRLTCGYCHEKAIVAADQPTDELNGWIIVVQSVNGQPKQEYYCSKSCAMNGIKLGGEPAIATPQEVGPIQMPLQLEGTKVAGA